ncbi:MAG: HAMP domain-containing protein [Spirochaetaceae bacterium]|nr:MAG: HAMP domain-containing protein [Spirochaetaceae bacterium]
MARGKRRRRLMLSGLESRMVVLFSAAIALAVLVVTLTTALVIVVQQSAGASAEEFLIVYRRSGRIEPVERDGRLVETRTSRTDAVRQTTRSALIIPVLLVNNVVLVVLLAIVGIRYARRFAGPIYRISTDIRHVLAGDRSVRINLRKTDELREFAQRINGLLDALERAHPRTDA